MAAIFQLGLAMIWLVVEVEAEVKEVLVHCKHRMIWLVVEVEAEVKEVLVHCKHRMIWLVVEVELLKLLPLFYVFI
jgi:hypothetical protein